MLAMPVATISEEVALSIRPALVKASRLRASGIHIAAYPGDSNSAAISPLWLADSVSWAKVHTPMVPRSCSSDVGQVDIAPSLGTVTRHSADPADWTDGL